MSNFWQTLSMGLKYCSPEDYRQALKSGGTALWVILQAAGVTSEQLNEIEKLTYKSLDKLVRGERDNA